MADFGPLELSSDEDETVRVALIAMVALMAAAVGYQGGALLAGATPDFTVLVPVFGGLVTILLASAADSE